MAAEQATCPETQRLIAGGSSLKIEFQDIQGHRLAGDSSAGVWRLLVPPKHRQAVFQHLHGIAHPGRLATRRHISSRFVWPGLSKDVTAWARECAVCQRSKIHRHFQVHPKSIPVPQRRFAHIHIDLVGPLTPSNGFNHILTVIDRTSRWMEAIPLANTAAAEVAAALFSGWICRFGVPAIITSDRGSQFTSSIWNSLCLLLQIKHQPTTAYHPQANGMVERLHRRLKDALRARGATATWAAELCRHSSRRRCKDDDSSPSSGAKHFSEKMGPKTVSSPKKAKKSQQLKTGQRHAASGLKQTQNIQWLYRG